MTSSVSVYKTCEENGCISVDLKAYARKKDKFRYDLKTVVEDERMQRHADPIEGREKINRMIRCLYEGGHYGALGAFVMGINTGYRTVDILNFRRCDLCDESGEIKDEVRFLECKTGKIAIMHINDTVKTMLKWLFTVKNTSRFDYVFTGEGNRKSYLIFDTQKQKIVEEETENTVKVVKHLARHSLERYLKEASEKAQIKAHCSTYVMRQTFSYHFRKSKLGDEEAMSVENVTLLSHYFNHSSLAVTREHYLRERKLMKERVLALELGKEAVGEIVKHTG